MLEQKIMEAYAAILREELVPATGCTEPIAIAYCAAKLRETLGAIPERVLAEVSGNILKNVKSVVVPNTNGLKGLKAAIAIGLVGGDADAHMQVISKVTEAQKAEAAAYMEETEIAIECPESPRMLDIRLTGYKGADTAVVHIANNHGNIVYIAKNDDVLLEKPMTASAEDNLQDKSVLNVKDIVEFVDTVDVEVIRPMVSRQIEYNSAIAAEGLKNNWGANIGSVLLANNSDIATEAKAWAAAGSDARMSGCEMPVIIVSGSGNQGMTASLPVWRYGLSLGASEEKILRAVALSDLITIHQKTGIGRLSAYCGAISAGVGAGAGIAYLHGGDYTAIAHTVVNAVAILSGTICDGAKPSCAAKIATAVEAGILGYHMYQHHQEFYGGDGIVAKGVEDSIHNVGILASQGMRETDRTILDIMTHC
ncbi:MAG: serine dehydratase subunit alpha family protein [Oscillospiraceae bacterium]|nr:serine dehydratase subunit alpha family protein [Oscillospiraceae bacterium]